VDIDERIVPEEDATPTIFMTDYSTITTGNELVDAGVIPKSSSQLMALITHERLKALQQRASKAIDPTQIGKWHPLFEPQLKGTGKKEITDWIEIRNTAQVGMHVRDRKDRNGTITQINAEGFLITLEATDREERWKPEAFTLVGKASGEIQKQIGYNLSSGAVADPHLGHIIRFERAYEFRSMDGSATIPLSSIATMLGYEAGRLTISVELPGKESSPRNYELEVDDYLASILSVSSLGQMEPRDLDAAIREDVLEKFFPTTVLEQELAQEIVIGLLMGKDMIFNGPPGSGKTNVVEDLRNLLESYAPHLFKVEGCQVQCDPYSLWDADHQETLGACPECQIRYDDQFRSTNRFTLADPKDVKVTVAKRGEGMGVEQIGGNVAVQLSDLTGFKPPRIAKDGTVLADASDPEGFQAGKLIRTNNGLLIIDEIDKLHRTTMDGLLNALAKERVMPADLRNVYPAHALVLGTSNEANRFSEALRDRILLFQVDYPTNPDVTYEIVKRAYHRESTAPGEFPIGDVYRMPPISADQFAFPVILERAVSSLFTRLRANRDIVGLNQIMVSSRAMLDSLIAARAFAQFDHVFDGGTAIVDEAHAAAGIIYALHARITAEATGRDEVCQSVTDYVAATFPKIVTEESDAWWCTVLKEVAVIDAAVADNYAEKFADNLRDYRTAPEKVLPAHQAVRAAPDQPETTLQYPLMSLFFRSQPGIAKLPEPAVEALVAKLLEYQQNGKCQL
jgi:MoxR-like ATPase